MFKGKQVPNSQEKTGARVEIHYQCGEDEVVVLGHHPHRHGLGQGKSKQKVHYKASLLEKQGERGPGGLTEKWLHALTTLVTAMVLLWSRMSCPIPVMAPLLGLLKLYQTPTTKHGP